MIVSSLFVALAMTSASPIASEAAQQNRYWIGTPAGGQLKFEVQIPAEIGAMVMKTAAAPGRGDDTRPKYTKYSHKVDGSTMIFYSNELAWSGEGLTNGELTWAVDAGYGAEWKNVDTNDPLYRGFAAAIKAQAKNVQDDWYAAKIFIHFGPKPAASLRLNADGSYGEMSPVAKATKLLNDLSPKARLNNNETASALQALLTITNSIRANPEYRKQNNCRLFRDLPSGLTPLRYDAALIKAAQNQAEYCAKVQESTHDQEDPNMADLGKRLAFFRAKNLPAYEAAGGGSLADCPIVWMKSETHFRPWWDLDGQAVTTLGFGFSKAADGTWYFVAVLQ
jgi:uncharacterized protein YkwD